MEYYFNALFNMNNFRPGQLATNRGNYLLIKLLEDRHPELFEMDTEKPVMETLETCIALSDQQRIVLSRNELPAIKRAILPLVSKKCILILKQLI